jgi:hypothetical protein
MVIITTKSKFIFIFCSSLCLGKRRESSVISLDIDHCKLRSRTFDHNTCHRLIAVTHSKEDHKWGKPQSVFKISQGENPSSQYTVEGGLLCASFPKENGPAFPES